MKLFSQAIMITTCGIFLNFPHLSHAQGDSFAWSPARWESALTINEKIPATKPTTAQKEIRVLGTLGTSPRVLRGLAQFLQNEKLSLTLQGLPWRQTQKRFSHRPLIDLLAPLTDRNVGIEVDFRYFDRVGKNALKHLPLLWVQRGATVHVYSRSPNESPWDYDRWEKIIHE